METIKSHLDYNQIIDDMGRELVARLYNEGNIARGVEPAEIVHELCDDSPWLIWNRDITDVINFTDHSDEIFLDGDPTNFDTMFEFLRDAAFQAMRADLLEWCDNQGVDL